MHRANSYFNQFLLAISVLTLAGFALYSDMFFKSNKPDRIPANTIGLNDLYKLEPDAVKKALIVNRSGTFRLMKETKNFWTLQEKDENGFHRKLPIKNEIIDKIFSFINDIQVKNKMSNNDINYKNYSFDQPLFEVALVDYTNKTYQIKFGINNSLDHSSYLFYNQLNQILKTKELNPEIAQLTINDIVEPRILNFQIQNIESVEIQKFLSSKRSNFIAKLHKENGQWFNSKNQVVEEEKLKHVLSRLSEIKSNIILNDQSLIDVSELVDEGAHPLITLRVKDTKQNEYTFNVMRISENIPNLNIKKNENLIVDSSLHNTKFVVNKKSLSIFESLQENRLKKLDVSKLFY
ncbi:MAG: DUF4340 domain-containing protein [Halobacteriovoraceae bacterium]|nr:DUF4340 domain-containing protein [Halobacteriovoraceae bacterium]MCB9095196.1 DUF4340 domain-containing protein [Halobacteriovoraceae bacterium]